MSLFVDENKLIMLKFQYVEHETSQFTSFDFVRSPEDFERLKADQNFHELKTGWKPLSWSEHNIIYSKCLNYLPNSEGLASGNLDVIKFRDLKLKACLKSWDLKDSQGQPIPVTSEVIDRLHPDVAGELLNAFEKVTEKEVKK